VGLSSALPGAFFHERPAAVSNAVRVFSIYRISDAAMLSAAVLLRHVAGTDSLSLLFGGARAAPTLGLTGTNATIIALLLIVAVAGKSALLPFSSWLPRAMEGPTPSSAVYYGSLSIHAGCFLLLRSAPLLEQAPAARLVAGGLGAATALFAGITTRVQSDVKSSLAYASLTQVGLIVVEIAIGWYRIAFLHLAGHACFRLLQFLSAPNVLHDLHGMEAAMGDRPARSDLTALFAGITTRVQSDVKSSLAYASLTQVGLIVVEIAIGWYRIAFLHLAGHACFRLLQFLSAPNVLHDLHGMEAAMGDRPAR